ncbi:MAG TPA: hypothetical protein VFZ42_03410 [Chitinophagaceae bacterium]
MVKKSSIQKIKIISYLQNVKLNSIKPFMERPSTDRILEEQEKKNELCAADLFSLFTADIIKEKVIFTR